MATVSRFGRAARYFAPLLILFLFTGSAAAPLPPGQAYREARAAVDRNDLRTAQAIAETALAHACPDDDRDAVWALRILLGEVIAKSGDGAAALTMLKPELRPRLRTSETAVYRLIALGIASYTTGSPEDVKRYFEQAHALAGRHHPQLLSKTHAALANIASGPDGERHLLMAATIAAQYKDELQLAIVKSTLQYVYARSGQLTRSVEVGEAALVEFKSASVFGRLGTLSGNLGWVYMELGDQDRAMELFELGIDAATQMGLDRERVAWISQRGNALFGQRQFGAAEQTYLEALDFGRRTNNDQLGDVLTNLARTALERGRYREAQQLNSEAIAERRRGRNPIPEVPASNLILQARIDTMTGNYPAAQKTLDTLLADATKRKSIEWEAEARLAQLYVRMDRAADADQAFENAINSFRDARLAVAKPELRLSYFSIAKDLLDTYVDFLVRDDRADDALAATEKSRAQTLLEQMNGTVGRYTDPRAIARQRGLTILSYWLGREHSYVWTVTPAEVKVAVLPSDETITALVEAYGRDLRELRRSIEASGERGRALYSMLIEPALHGTTPSTPVAIIADGRLHTLNFETLVTGQPAHYWIEDVVLSSASSVQILARAEPKPVRNEGMLLVGDALPVSGYPALPHAADEIQKVTRHFRDPKTLTRENATPTGYRNADPGRYAFIHFVAHGVASGRRPLDSAIILSPDSGGYKLIARDIMAQPLNARLVTISSCKGAGERTYAGEGLVGLAWAFLRAGSDEVVAALWDVDDSATPDLMNDFYAGIRAGRTPAAALRDAKLKLLHQDNVLRFPVYWAPFVLYSGS